MRPCRADLPLVTLDSSPNAASPSRWLD
uniref:Uncharacterized protein n=1 Tax=Arundo donax TaxID=35708 RepID=A0A0A9BCY6_ARUDO